MPRRRRSSNGRRANSGSPASSRRGREETGSGFCFRRGGRKWVTLIRHGQSKAQVAPKGARRDMLYRDAALTGKGIGQAQGLSAKVSVPELVVISNLSRALQTACLLFKKHPDVPMLSTPVVCELGKIPENIPRPLAELKKDSNLAGLPGFDRIDFSEVRAFEEEKDAGEATSSTSGPTGTKATDKWSQDGKMASESSLSRRSAGSACEKFVEWLERRPETFVTLVGHSTFMRKLIGNTSRVDNCDPIEVEISRSGVRIISADERIKAWSEHVSSRGGDDRSDVKKT